jgi:DNA-directed RNA polymerase subunit M/transcription elongation factor TFIIS
MSEEANRTICKVCRKIKMRIQSGKYPDSKDKKWVDESGVQWNGRTCPDCHRERMKFHVRKVRSTGTPDSN